MRWTRWVGLVIVTLALGAAIVSGSCTKAQPPTNDVGANKLERGKYLVTVTGCNDCHTPGSLYGAPDTTRLLSGSELGWQGPWGVSYPRNITPDLETGIGKWSEADIVNTIRTGQRPDKTPLLPPMPWTDFAAFSDDDAYAVAAYLKSIPPVVHKMPDAVPPGTKVSGSIIVFPPPSAWDAKNLPPPPADPAAAGGGH
jgi:mono/diheme cytochrome c family protein